MAYTSLYRNYRPLKFSEIVGQDHITTTLKNQVMSSRVGHAYLFTGGRGTGKTSAAKILARAINCENLVDGEPCNECEICKGIISGSLTDVVEMDAASNNGVDNIRDIIDEVNFLPTKAKYRVYIIDEVHMLSTGAFNALLKTLEEPPSHVKFILATTEPQKLPLTILSRCQRFDFKKISESNIVKRLKYIADDAKINIDDEALKLIAVLSEGHMRDAISILERCAQENLDMITPQSIRLLVGIPEMEYINGIARAILENSTMKALEVVDKVIEEGKDLTNFLWEIIKYFKDILVYKTTNNLNIYTQDEIVEIKNLADIVDEDTVLNIIYLLSDLENDLKHTTQKTIMFQTGIIKACRKESFATLGIAAIEKRLSELESKVTNLKFGQDTTIGMQEAKDGAEETAKEKPNINIKKSNLNESSSKMDMAWKKVIDILKNQGKIRLFGALVNSRAHELDDMNLEIIFPTGLSPINKQLLEMPANEMELKKVINSVLGKEMHIKFKDGKNVSKPNTSSSGGVANSKIQDIKNLGIDINEIEQ